MKVTTKEEREWVVLDRKWAMGRASKKEILRCMELKRKLFPTRA